MLTAASGSPQHGATAGDHEIRVSACLDDGCGNIILRCRCGQAWDLEPGHTTAELGEFAAQHSGTPPPAAGHGRQLRNDRNAPA